MESRESWCFYMIEKLYTVEEVAELASVTGRTIRNYLKSGRLVGRKIGGQWRFPEAEVQRLLTGAEPEPATPTPEPIATPQTNATFDDVQDDSDVSYINDNFTFASADDEPDELPAPVQHYAQPAPLPAPQPVAAPVVQQPAIIAEPIAPQPVAAPVVQQPAIVAEPIAPQPVAAPVVQQPAIVAEPIAPQPVAPPAYVTTEYTQPAAAPTPAAAFSQPAPTAPAYPAAPQTYQQAAPLMPIPPAASGLPQQSTAYSQTTATYTPAPAAAYYAPPTTTPIPTAAPQEATAAKSADATPENPQVPPISDIGRKVAHYISEVHDCSLGPQMCAVIDLNQALPAAKLTSERLADIAAQESEDNVPCQCFVEYDDRFFMARYTLFGSTSFLLRCLKLLG